MSRIVWPHALLLTAGRIDDASVTERVERIRKSFFPDRKASDFGPPVALRWASLPALGLPRRPFEVFRRARPSVAELLPLATAPVSVDGLRVLELGGAEQCEVQFRATPQAGGRLTVVALDRRGEAIPGQRLSFATQGGGRFRCPGLFALRLSGKGSLSELAGQAQAALANAAGWELVERVGLPIDAEATAASLRRLELSALLQAEPPALDGAPVAWPFPKPEALLAALRERELSPLGLARTGFEQSRDDRFESLQADVRHRAKLPGLRQLDVSGSEAGTEDIELDLPIADLIQLAVAQDGAAATGLGFGTLDFPPPVSPAASRFPLPAGQVELPFDYLVSCEVELPVQGTLTLAALAWAQPAPSAVGELAAREVARNRPPRLNAPSSASVELAWAAAPVPTGFGVLVERAGAGRQILNEPLAGGVSAFVPARAAALDGAPSLEARERFVETVAPVPLVGETGSRYALAPLDRFGRWGDWRTVEHVLAADPVAPPALLGAALVPTEAGPSPVGPGGVRCALELELGYDLVDRSLDRIEVAGAFLAPGASLDPGTTGFAGVEGSLGVHFLPDGTLTAVTVPDGLVLTTSFEELVAEDADPEETSRRYRVVVAGLTFDFGAQREAAFAVTARAVETVRPGEASAPAGVVVARLGDPRPVAVPELSPELRFTALPGADRTARAVLTWPPVPEAVGYVVWRSEEQAPEDFHRAHERPLREPRFEVVLSGEARSRTFFAVSALSAGGLETPRSAAVPFAVPRLVAPAAPRLSVRPEANGAAVVVDLGDGPAVAEVALHRVAEVGLAQDLGLMGPPVATVLVPEGEATLRFVDPAVPSWRPYLYRAVARAASDLAAGVVGGPSAPSAAVEVLLTPPPPRVARLRRGDASTHLLLSVENDLPVVSTPVGEPRFELVALYVQDGQRGLVRRTLVSVVPATLPVSTGAPPTGLEPTLVRRPINPAGFTSVVTRLPAASFAPAPGQRLASILVRLSDPLGRVVEASFPA